MVPVAPWTVKTTKRQNVKNATGPRKRRRASLSAEDQDGSRARRRKQQTLTQIQWAPSRPVSYEEGEMEPMEVKTELRNRSRRGVTALKKRNSTLTQMDFLLGRPSIEMSEQDLTPLLVSKEEGAAVPQLDGIYDSPRKPRPPKTVGAGARAGLHRTQKIVSLPAENSQEYLPARKRRKGKAEADADADETPEGWRRRSARNARKLPSDPAENFAVLQEAFADTTPRLEKPTLDIKDSTGFDEDVDVEELAQPNRLSHAVARPGPANYMQAYGMDQDLQEMLATLKKTAPRTPQTERDYIPSSQSPESLPPSTTKKDAASHSTQRTTPKRNALVELSTNTPTRRHMTDVDDFLMPESTSKRKICTLHLPRVPPGPMRKRLEDSQVDIWAIQPTSSPKSKGKSQGRPEDVLPDESIQGEQAEIPSTSQAQNETVITSSPPHPAEAETQESLVSLNAILGIKRQESVNTNKESESPQASTTSNLKTRDFATLPQQSPQKQTQYVAFLQTQPGQIDEADEFGSPVANDTQFAAHLAHIPTSPIGTRDPLEHLNPHDTIRISSPSFPDGAASSSPLPAPKLVDRVAYQNSTTIIPTKDVSSPTLPPMPPSMQRSIAPAPLPHPSQISTQEPSQQLPQPSSVPQRSPTRTQRITIKDSSSMHEHLSQLPEYNEDELQLQRELESTQHQVSDEDDDEDVNDDLDPKTPRKTVRFEQLPQQSELPEQEANAQDDSPSRREEEINGQDPSPPANFTQNGHVTAARIEDMRKRGLIPPGYNPPAYKVPPARELLPAWMFEDDDDEL